MRKWFTIDYWKLWWYKKHWCFHPLTRYEDFHDQFEPLVYCRICGKKLNDPTE